MTEVTPAIRRFRRVAPLALVVVLATACGGDDEGTATPTTTPTTPLTATTTGNFETLPTPTVPTGGGNPGGKGTLVIGKRDFFPLLKGDLRRFAPTQVEGKSLQIVALAGEESFWAGRNRNQRILVKMRLKGGSPPAMEVGQKVGFIGLLTTAPEDAGALGVVNDGDKTLLEKQGAYVDASVADVRLG